LHDRLIEALSADPDGDGDGFVFSAASPTPLMHDAAGQVTWRVKVTGALAGRPFGGIHLDVSPRSHELEVTDVVPLPNSLEFAGVRTRDVEIIEVHRAKASRPP
jgi:hypothetical protein